MLIMCTSVIPGHIFLLSARLYFQPSDRKLHLNIKLNQFKTSLTVFHHPPITLPPSSPGKCYSSSYNPISVKGTTTYPGSHARNLARPLTPPAPRPHMMRPPPTPILSSNYVYYTSFNFLKPFSSPAILQPLSGHNWPFPLHFKSLFTLLPDSSFKCILLSCHSSSQSSSAAPLPTR